MSSASDDYWQSRQSVSIVLTEWARLSVAPWKQGASWLVHSGMRMAAGMLWDLWAGGGSR